MARRREGGTRTQTAVGRGGDGDMGSGVRLLSLLAWPGYLGFRISLGTGLRYSLEGLYAPGFSFYFLPKAG